MKHIEYRSFWKYSNIGILHDVFIIDGIVWSWEISFPFFWQGRFVLYNEEEWRKDVKEIILEQELPDVNMSPYKNVMLRGINCVEILDKILRENNAWFIIPFGFYIYKKLKFATIYLMMLVAAFLFGYYWLTDSIEDVLQDNKCIIIWQEQENYDSQIELDQNNL